jgi:hypothetical protein
MPVIGGGLMYFVDGRGTVRSPAWPADNVLHTRRITREDADHLRATMPSMYDTNGGGN